MQKIQVITPGNEVALSEDVETRLKQFAKDKDAFSPNTWSQLISCMRLWARWAAARGYPWLPAHPRYVREWCEWQDKEGLAVTTIKNRLTLLNILHENAGLEKPGQDPHVRRAMRIMNRQAVYGEEEQGQAIPFRRQHLDELTRQWEYSDRLQQLRDLAFLSVAYNTLLRIAEIARIRVGRLTFNPDGSATIKVGYTKTTLTSSGIIKHLSPRVATVVKRWIDAAGLEGQDDMMLFCGVHRLNKAIPKDKPLTRPNIETIYSRAWDELHDVRGKANKGRYKTWSGHSARVGACIDLLEAGVSLEKIMLEGNWSSPGMVLHYLRHALAGNSLMSKLLSD